MALPPLELPPIERVALLPGGPFALWKRWAEIEHCDETGEKPFYAQGAKWTSEGRGVRAAVHARQSCRPLRLHRPPRGNGTSYGALVGGDVQPAVAGGSRGGMAPGNLEER
jgi:hypothetical protein